MGFVDPSQLDPLQRLPGWTARVFHSQNMTFIYYEIAASAVPLHEHHHLQEEVWNVLEGAIAITIDGREQVVGAGCAAVVPPNVPHSARVIGSCRAIIVDHPLRPEMGRPRASG